MGHYARGDSRKMICSSDDDEGYLDPSQLSSTSNSTMSQINISDKRNLLFGIFGEAPPVPLPPVSDETDRQFWAEDELSSSESRNFGIPRRKRKHSVSYRNRAAVRASRSGLLVHSSSSSGAEAARRKIPPSVRRRRRLRNCGNTSRVQRPRVSSSGARREFNPKTVTRLVAAGNANLAANCEFVQPAAQDQRFSSARASLRSETAGASPNSQNAHPPSNSSKSHERNAGRNRIAKLKALTKTRRK